MRKRRVIVFDDEVLILKLFKSFFSARGYEVLTYSEPVACPMFGKDSETCSRTFPCADVIVTDYKMPGMDGLQLLREQSRLGCRLTAKNRALTSGFLDENLKKTAAELECAFFQKPIVFSEFAAWVAECEKRVDPSQPLASRRVEPRQPTSREIAYMVSQSGILLDGVAVNISDSGLCLQLTGPLTKEQTVSVKSGLPNAGRTASVRWIQKEDDGSYLAGLRYSKDSQNRSRHS